MLKVSHHGSYTGTSEKLVKKLKVKSAFISAGRPNSGIFPHKDCINALTSNKVNTIITNKVNRSVLYDSDGSSISVM